MSQDAGLQLPQAHHHRRPIAASINIMATKMPDAHANISTEAHRLAADSLVISGIFMAWNSKNFDQFGKVKMATGLTATMIITYLSLL